jgi:hypothetical protein
LEKKEAMKLKTKMLLEKFLLVGKKIQKYKNEIDLS